MHTTSPARAAPRLRQHHRALAHFDVRHDLNFVDAVQRFHPGPAQDRVIELWVDAKFRPLVGMQ
ncbi:MAG TPA: hypothetical protein VI793_19825 [Anaerolineales bacterium]|nr:hypothetical protein [Anaerolineales bacterium]